MFLQKKKVFHEKEYLSRRIRTGTQIPGYQKKKEKKSRDLAKWHDEKTRSSSSFSKKVVEEQPSCRVVCVCGSSRSECPGLAGLLTAIVGSITYQGLIYQDTVYTVLHLFASTSVVLLSLERPEKEMKSSRLSYCPVLTF